MKYLFLCLIVVLTNPVSAEKISVAGTKIEIPAPAKYAQVIPEMTALYTFQKQFVAPNNIEFISFIPEEDVPLALKDEIPYLERRMTVQTSKSFQDISMSNADFARLRQVVNSQNGEVLKKAEATIEEVVGGINESLTEEYDIDLALSVNGIVPLTPHLENERSMAYSSFVRYEFVDETGEPGTVVVVVTSAFVFLKGKILFLYTYAEESGLDWSRGASNKWVDAVLLANK